MRRLLVASACLLGGVAHLAMSVRESTPKTTSVRIGSCVLQVEVAETPARRATGLSHATALPADGMLLRWERPALHAIWMRDMRYPLDLAWLDEAHVVRAVLADAPPCAETPCEIYAPPGAAASTAVLETAAGRLAACGVRVGDRLDLPVPALEVP